MKPLHLLTATLTTGLVAGLSLVGAPASANPWLTGDLSDYCNTHEVHNLQEEHFSHAEGTVSEGSFTPAGAHVLNTTASNTAWSSSSADLVASRDCSAVVQSAAQVHMFETQVRSNYLMNLLAW